MLPGKISKRVILFLFLSGACIIGGIYIYLKKRHPHPLSSLPTEAIDKSETTSTNFFFDLETTEGLSGTENIKQSNIIHSGQMVCDLSGGKEYGFSVLKKIGDAGPFPLKRAAASIWVYPLSENTNVVLTASIINSKSETIFWDGKSTEKISFPANKWTKLNALYNFPVEKLSVDDVLQINIWNKGKTDVLVDDLELVYGDSPERRGSYSGIDANAFYENRFVSQRNSPPFQNLYLKKLEINNNDSTQLIPGNKDIDLSPNDEYLVGDFIDDKNNLDELLYFKNNKTFILGFDPEKQQFHVLQETESFEKKAEDGSASKKFAGDFNADGKTDVLIADKNAWNLFEYKDKYWKTIASGKNWELKADWFLSHSKPFVSNLFSLNSTDALVLPGNTSYYLLQFNKASGTFDETASVISKADSGLFNATSYYYQGHFTGRGIKEFLRYDTEWRFDLKLLEKDKNGYVISGTLDFEGFKNDCNPKYYEFLKIIPGNFTPSKKTSLLTIMRNCADKDFNGVRCNTFENINYLPNSIQLYTIKEACVW